MTESNVDRILAALQRFDPKPAGRNKYRYNSPLRPGSNSHAFAITVDPEAPGGGVWFDHVSGEGGDFVDLEPRLFGDAPATPHAAPVPRSEPAYSGLDEYARAHGVPADVLRAAGWKEADWYGTPALAFPTPHGPRFRLLDGGDTKYIQAKGYTACLYGLERALEIAGATGQPLTLCNGEASTAVAQHYGVAAFCQNMGEKRLTDENLAQLRSAYPTGAIIIALDCDAKGRKAALDLKAQLEAAGYEVRAVDLNGGKGFDLANFAQLHQGDTPAALQALGDVPPPKAADCGHTAEIERLRQTIAAQQREIEALKAEQRAQNDLIQNDQISATDKITILITRRELAVQAPRVPAPEAPRPVNFTALAARTGQSSHTVSRCVKKFNGILWERHVVNARDEATGEPRTIIQLAPLPALIEDLRTIAPAQPRNHGGKREKKLCLHCGSDHLTEYATIFCDDCGRAQGAARETPINDPKLDEPSAPPADVAPVEQVAHLKNEVQVRPSLEQSLAPVEQVAHQVPALTDIHHSPPARPEEPQVEIIGHGTSSAPTAFDPSTMPGVRAGLLAPDDPWIRDGFAAHAVALNGGGP